MAMMAGCLSMMAGRDRAGRRGTRPYGRSHRTSLSQGQSGLKRQASSVKCQCPSAHTALYFSPGLLSPGPSAMGIMPHTHSPSISPDVPI